MSTTVIRGGLMITATEETRSDVLVDGERVVALDARTLKRKGHTA